MASSLFSFQYFKSTGFACGCILVMGMAPNLCIAQAQATQSEELQAPRGESARQVRSVRSETEEEQTLGVKENENQTASSAGEKHVRSVDAREARAIAETDVTSDKESQQNKKEADKKEKDRKESSDPAQDQTKDRNKEPVKDLDNDRNEASNQHLPRPKLPPNPVTANPATSATPAVPTFHNIQSPAKTRQQEDLENNKIEPNQFLLISSTMTSARDAERALQSYNVQVKDRRALKGLNLVATVYRLSGNRNTLKVIKQIQAHFPDLLIDANHIYSLQGDAQSNVVELTRRTYSHNMIGWPIQPALHCIHQPSLHIGMLDTPVDNNHTLLQQAAITTANFSRGSNPSAEHGTAVASLLVGGSVKAPNGPTLGLLPEANLYAANVFRVRDDKLEATTQALLLGVNWLVEQNVSIVNLSLGGKENTVLAEVLKTVMQKGITVVASAGNSGPQAKPVYPAAQPGVVAVTAVDAARHVYQKANAGSYIDLAAPGVDVWAAGADQSAQYHSGSSFASPFVVGALLLVSKEALFRTAVDLGQPGKDNQFGYGLINISTVCDTDLSR